MPANLAARFEIIRELRGAGAEGLVVQCRDREHDGRLCAVKVYHQGLEPDVEVHQALLERSISSDARTLRLYEVLEVDGMVVEVLEWVEHGSLLYLFEAGVTLDPVQVAESLWRAVSEFQAAVDGGHFDVKPANILGRTLNPLELVLGDFGLARVVEGSVRLSRQAGTIAYAPPEAGLGWGHVGKARSWDWWSVGMIVAEVAMGRHPLSLPDGSMPPDAVLTQTEALRGHTRVDLSVIGDERLADLCAGLLTPNASERWSGPEVEQWLAGGSPAISDGLLGQDWAAPQRTVEVRFSGRDCRTSAELVAAFQSDWIRAQEQLFQERDHALVQDTLDLAKASGIDEIEDLLAEIPDPVEIPRRMARLLLILDPYLHPVFDNIELSRGGLEAAALDVINGSQNSVHRRRQLQAIRQGQVLTQWRHVPGMGHAAAIDERWQPDARRLEQLLSGLGRGSLHKQADVAALAHARLLLAVIDQRYDDEMLNEALTLNLDPGHAPAWWANVRNLVGQDRAAAALALAAFPAGQAHAAESAEKAAQEDAVAEAERKDREKQAAAQAKATKEADRQRERDRRDRVAREARIASGRARSRVARSGMRWAGRLTQTAVVLGVVLEWRAGERLGRVFVDGGPFFGWQFSLLVLAAASILFKSTDSERPAVLGSAAMAVGAAVFWLRQPERSLYLSVGESVSDDLNFLVLADLAFLAAAALAVAHAALFLLEEAAQAVIQDRSAQQLWHDDLNVLRATGFAVITGVVPCVVGLVLIWRSLDGPGPESDLLLLGRASWLDTAIAGTARGVWLPPLVAAVILFSRGSWTRRWRGLTAAAVLVLAALIAGAVGIPIANERLSTIPTSTPVPEEVVEGGRFCSAHWTGTRFPTRTVIAGDACETLYQYLGWDAQWSTSLSGKGDINRLISLGGTYVVMFDGSSLAIGYESSSGSELWRHQCAGGMTIDESQLDRGEDTPAMQRFAGTCGDSSFQLDPISGLSG